MPHYSKLLECLHTLKDPLVDPGEFGGVLGGCNPHGLLREKQKQAKTMYLVRCGQVATPPVKKSWPTPGI